MNYKAISVRYGNSNLLHNTIATSEMRTKLGIITRRNGSVHSYSGDSTKIPWNWHGSVGQKQGVTNDTGDLNYTINRFDWGEIRGAPYSTFRECTFSTSSHRTFRKMGIYLAIKEILPLLTFYSCKFWNSFVSCLCFFPELVLPIPASRPPILWPSRLNSSLLGFPS